MAETVAQMTPAELQGMIEHVIDEKFAELLGDPDAGLELRDEVKQRLIEQQRRVEAGDLGEPLDVVVRRLGLD